MIIKAISTGKKLFSVNYSAKKPIIVFLVIWLHVTLLDLFYINNSGVVFLWQESLRPITLFTHLLVAFSVLAFYFMVTKLRNNYQHGKYKVGQHIWLYCSLVMIFTIGFLLF